MNNPANELAEITAIKERLVELTTPRKTVWHPLYAMFIGGLLFSFFSLPMLASAGANLWLPGTWAFICLLGVLHLLVRWLRALISNKDNT